MTTMIEVKTADLIGPALDWAVAKADGHDPLPKGFACRYSTDWGQGGPLIDLYRVMFDEADDGQLLASCTIVPCLSRQFDMEGEGIGQTYLVAACRAIVSAKLGDVVQVPAELVEVRHAD